MSENKTVLMLDHEPMMIDRRIVLEAQSLVSAGYRVVLATQWDGKQPHEEIERGMEVLRFPRGTVNKKIHAREKITRWNTVPGNERVELFVRKWFAWLPRYLQILIYGIIRPEIMAAVVRRRAPRLKRLLGPVLEPLIYGLLIRPCYIWPYFLVWNGSRGQNAETVADHMRLNEYQQEIFDFAVQDLRPSIIHAHDLPNLPLGRKIAKALQARLVYDAHELYPMQFFSSEQRRTTLAKLERQLIEHVDATIAVNHQCEEVLRKEYPFLRDVVILSNATESPKNFDPAVKLRLWHETFNLDESVQLMVFQGGINPVRNVDHLLRAMAKMPEFIHVGFITYRKDVPYYEALTRELGIYDRVHYVFEIPWHEVNNWLASADVGMMPYQATNFNAKISSPNKLFEFMVAGLPIIASSELVNVKEAIDIYHVGVYRFFRDDDSYIEAMTEMFDPNLGGPQRFIPNVMAARSKFTWENEEPRLLDLYARLNKEKA